MNTDDSERRAWTAPSGEYPEIASCDEFTVSTLLAAERNEEGKPLYDQIRKIGEGSFGVVFRARDIPKDRHVAIKVFKLGAAIQDAERGAAFEHPGVVTVYRTGTLSDGKTTYLEMELVEGTSLQDHILNGSLLPPSRICEIGIEIAKALADVQQRTRGEPAKVHGDVRPANILLSENGGVKLCDFSLVTRTRAEQGPQNFAGAAGYRAPEVKREGLTSTRSDIYSLGVTLYVALEGGLPDTTNLQFEKSDPPDDLVVLIEKCLEENSKHRPQAKEVVESLRRILSRPAPTPPPVTAFSDSPSHPVAQRPVPQRSRLVIRRLTGIVTVAGLILAVIAVWWSVNDRNVTDAIRASRGVDWQALAEDFRRNPSSMNDGIEPIGHRSVTLDLRGFEVLSDSKYFDLSDWVAVKDEVEILSGPLEAAYFTRVLKLRKRNGLPNDEVAVQFDTTGYGVIPLRTRPGDQVYDLGDGTMAETEHAVRSRVMIIDTSEFDAEPFTLTIHAIAFNGFQDMQVRGAEEEWTSSRIAIDTASADLAVSLPKSIPFHGIRFAKRNIGEDRKKDVGVLEGTTILHNRAIWRIPSPKAGQICTLYWTWGLH